MIGVVFCCLVLFGVVCCWLVLCVDVLCVCLCVAVGDNWWCVVLCDIVLLLCVV